MKHNYFLPGAYNEPFWTSGIDPLEGDMRFYWDSTGHNLGPYVKSAVGQIYDADGECLVLNSTLAYSWSTFSCSEGLFRYICEKPETPQLKNVRVTLMTFSLLK